MCLHFAPETAKTVVAQARCKHFYCGASFWHKCPAREATSVHKLYKCNTSGNCKTAVTKFASHHTEAKPAGWSSGKRHCYQCRQGRILGGGGYILKQNQLVGVVVRDIVISAGRGESWGVGDASPLPTSHSQTCF